MSTLQKLRMLDIDDLYILSYMFDGQSSTEAGASLGLTQPAVSHRIRKMRDLFGQITMYDQKRLTLTPDGVRLGAAAKAACELLNDSLSDHAN
jgi:DNA-binding transcriptional LysR family regulator